MVHSPLLLRGGDKSVPEGENHIVKNHLTPGILASIIGGLCSLTAAVWVVFRIQDDLVDRIDELEKYHCIIHEGIVPGFRDYDDGEEFTLLANFFAALPTCPEKQ